MNTLIFVLWIYTAVITQIRLWLHLDYLQRQNSPEFREGVKRLKIKNRYLFINLNKSEKDFSPSTMYEDYAINDKLFHWQSKVRIGKRVQKYRDILITRIQVISYHYLFVNLKGLVHIQHHILFLGNADYVKHEGERPVSFVWSCIIRFLRICCQRQTRALLCNSM